MANGGRLGEPTRAVNLNITLTINGNDHSRRIGDLFVEVQLSVGKIRFSSN